jgi:uncharacterized protein (TIGR00290 family)
MAICSSSGGKDSMLALWHARERGVHATTLVTMLEETGERSRSHGVPLALHQQQARALGLELVAPRASWKDYERVFVETLTRLRAEGHTRAIFGDIDLEPHREWEERVCREAGIEPFLPLWQRDRRALAEQAIELGFQAVVVCVDSRHLDDDFCGRRFDRSFLADLPPGVDACGENGEFHTFVIDGPLFARPVACDVTDRRVYVSSPELGSQRYCFATLADRQAPALGPDAQARRVNALGSG